MLVVASQILSSSCSVFRQSSKPVVNSLAAFYALPQTKIGFGDNNSYGRTHTRDHRGLSINDDSR